MKKFHYAAFLLIVGLMLSLPQTVFAHCQVPCGIYDDYARVKGMMEDAATVKKSVKLLNELAGKTDVQSQQQFVRWVNTKEMHAQKVISTIADYFLTQRVKASQKDYVERLTKHHAVIVAAMKAKQNATMEAAEALEKAIMELEDYYPHEH